MRAYWALWWRVAFVWAIWRYVRRGWEKNPYRQDVTR